MKVTDVRIRKVDRGTALKGVATVTFDEMLSDCDKYETVKHKYGESVSWMLQFIDSETRREVQMYGATSYILVTADGVSKEIDMTEYDSGVNKNTSESTSENTIDSTTDSTSTEIEDTSETIDESIDETDVNLDESEETINEETE